jgi:hypothetical protein
MFANILEKDNPSKGSIYRRNNNKLEEIIFMNI